MRVLGISVGVLGFVFVILIALIFGYFAQKFGARKGYGDAACFAAGFFFGIVGLIVILLLPDKNNESKSAADELLGYKQLLDSGAITQEEFDEKKKELL